MELGIFTRTFTRPSLEQTLDEVAKHGFSWVQYKFMDPTILYLEEEERANRLAAAKAALDRRQIRVAALSGTYNIIHDDPQIVQEGEDYVRRLSEVAPSLGTNLITLCTGTKDPSNMWAFHPNNRTPEAWNQMLSALERLLQITESSQCILGVEPEYNNIVHSAASARKLLDTLPTERVKIIVDAANLLLHCAPEARKSTLAEAFDLLGSDIVLAHGKDLKEQETHDDVIPGTGYVDFAHYLTLLKHSPYQGPFVLHGFSEQQTPAAVTYIQSIMTALDLADH